MKNFSLIVLIFVSGFSFNFSQKEKNTWYFGNNAGLDFNSGAPIALTNGTMFTYDNCASVSDNASGSILFYSNGIDAWGANHQVMPNGSGLLGNTSGGNSAFAVHQPGTSSMYYLFTNDAFAGPNGLRYSIIDMMLNGGLGDVTSTKNIPLISSSTEKITAVAHANNQDIWLIAHPWNSNEFHAYLLTNTGLNTTPVISAIGSTHTGGSLGTYNAIGQIAANQAGNKLVCAIYDLETYELFDFDRSTGMLSNLISISGYPNAWGTEFSPNGNVLYTTQWGGTGASDLHQFDLSSNDQTTINNSATIVGTVTSPDASRKAGYLQLGPDGRIYVAKFTDSYLGAVVSPNTVGIGCNYSDTAVYLAGKICEAGLPSFIQTYRDVKSGITDENVTDNFSVYPNPFSSECRIDINNGSILKFDVEFYDLCGKKIVAISDCSLPFDLKNHHLPVGTYFIRLFQEANVIGVKKIVIQ
jgi:hypothetical protein